MAFKAIAGGLLTGLGKGMVAQDEARREEAERMRQEALERARRQAEQDFQLRRDELQHERQGGLLSRTVTGEDGTVFGVTRGGEVKDLGITARDKDGSGGSLSASDKREWEMVVDRFTSTSLNGEQTDWQGVAEEFKRRGREDLARLAMPPGGTQAERDAARETARAQAEEEAEGRTSFFRPRSSEFPETQGSMEEWINRRTEEILSGGGRSTGQDQQRQDASGGGQQTPRSQGAAADYNSADAVKRAYQAGQITREQAIEILRSKFGFQ